MTKTLTEQWREGILERGYYYYKTKVGAKVIGYQCFGLKFPYDYYHNTIDSVKEVLALVPSYDEVKEMSQKIERLEYDSEAQDQVIKCLQKQLSITTKALKEIDVRSQRDWDEYDCMGCAKKALYDIEMEGVK